MGLKFRNPRSVSLSAFYQLDTVIKLLPRLQYGLDVNVRFNSIRGFEFTEEMAAFDMSGVTLLHGWIVDPEDKRTVRLTLDIAILPSFPLSRQLKRHAPPTNALAIDLDRP